ncbi:hypothetical protein [Litorimonas sp. WD9-15]|uniref:hypothetical protein n=1 Tax=Litorimonas sp. WD9-15 TaxID=3418716 RepID=UPI003D019561
MTLTSKLQSIWRKLDLFPAPPTVDGEWVTPPVEFKMGDLSWASKIWRELGFANDRLDQVPILAEHLALFRKAVEAEGSAVDVTALQMALTRLCDRVEAQTKVTEAIIVRDAHPDHKLSDGSHVIQTLNLHIHDAIAEARAALPKEEI